MALHRRLTRREILRAGTAMFALGATAGGTVEVLAGCGSAQPADATPDTTTTPADGAPVVRWDVAGGWMMPISLVELHAARLVAYSDGEVIADAAYRSLLDADALRELVTALVADLRPYDVSRTKLPSVTDSQTSHFSVWTGRTAITVDADGIEDQRERSYPAAIYAAHDRLATVYKDVQATGQPYLASRVRVVAEKVVDKSPEPDGAGVSKDVGAEVRAWPAEVTMPWEKALRPTGLFRADLSADDARRAVRMLTRDLDQNGAWPTYRLTDGGLVRASWRYLLPHE